jgi:uncharacterized protein YgiB involved in biofilm formation
MTSQELYRETTKFILENPEIKEQISDFYYLALDEIQDGQSETHECNMAYNDMLQLVKEHQNG